MHAPLSTPVYLSKAVLPHMKHGGAIINTTSVAAYKGRADMIDCARPTTHNADAMRFA